MSLFQNLPVLSVLSRSITKFDSIIAFANVSSCFRPRVSVMSQRFLICNLLVTEFAILVTYEIFI